MHTCIYVTNISNNNNSNQYMHIHMYISQLKLIIDHKHIPSSCHLCMTNISNNNNSNQYIYIYISHIYVIIIIYHLTTLCVHDILPFIFVFMFQFVSFSISHSCFKNTFIHVAFSIFSLFHAYYTWHFIYL